MQFWHSSEGKLKEMQSRWHEVTEPICQCFHSFQGFFFIYHQIHGCCEHLAAIYLANIQVCYSNKSNQETLNTCSPKLVPLCNVTWSMANWNITETYLCMACLCLYLKCFLTGSGLNVILNWRASNISVSLFSFFEVYFIFITKNQSDVLHFII